jgi:hypothetical protein
MESSFFSRSALKGPTPFKYSIGLNNILLVEMIISLDKNKIKEEPMNLDA